jgi:hypothetical protein
MRLRGEKALDACGQTPALRARRHVCAQSGDAEPAPALPRPEPPPSCMRRRRPIASAPHFDGQDVLESGLPRPGPRLDRLAQPRARGARARRRANPHGSQRASRSGRLRRWSCAVPRRCCHGRRRGCRPTADDTVDAAARSLSPHRSGARARARGAHGACRQLRAGAAARPSRARASAAARPRLRARLFSAESAGAPRRNSWPRADGPRIGALAFERLGIRHAR